MFSLRNKVAIVTGGGSGIGESICKTFADAGAKVYVWDVDEANGNRVAAEIRDNGKPAVFQYADVTNQQLLSALTKEIVAGEGRLDILVSNAGIAHVGSLSDTEEDDFDTVYKVNVKGVYNSMYAVIEHMKKQKSGVIINMASIAATTGIFDRFAYSMSKGAVYTMTLSVAKDYIEDGIRCNSISPARIHTPFVDAFLRKNYPGREAEMFGKLSRTQPIGRMGKPEEIAALALYLCSDEASFITGCDYPVDGGFIKLNGS